MSPQSFLSVLPPVPSVGGQQADGNGQATPHLQDHQMTEEKEPVGVSAVREDNKMTTDALPVIMNWSGAVLPGVVTFVFKCYGVADLTTQHN